MRHSEQERAHGCSGTSSSVRRCGTFVTSAFDESVGRCAGTAQSEQPGPTGSAATAFDGADKRRSFQDMRGASQGCKIRTCKVWGSGLKWG